MVAMVLGIICNYQFSSVLFWLLEVMKKLLSDMMEWYVNLTGWKHVIYGG